MRKLAFLALLAAACGAPQRPADAGPLAVDHAALRGGWSGARPPADAGRE